MISLPSACLLPFIKLARGRPVPSKPALLPQEDLGLQGWDGLAGLGGRGGVKGQSAGLALLASALPSARPALAPALLAGLLLWVPDSVPASPQ